MVHITLAPAPCTSPTAPGPPSSPSLPAGFPASLDDAPVLALLPPGTPITEAVGDDQLGLFTRGGAEMFQLSVQTIFEEFPHLTVLSIDARNAFNAISREAIMAALQANPRLHGLIPAFKMLYMNRPTKLLFIIIKCIIYTC